MQRHKPDFILLVIILSLVAFGLVMVYSASMVWAIKVNGTSPSYYFEHQLLTAIVGVLVMTLLMNVSYTFWMKHARGISILTLFGVLIVLIPGIGHKAQNVRRWIGPVILHMQPSEIALVGIIIYLAYIYSKNRQKVQSFSHGVMPPLAMVGTQFVLIILEPDMGTAVLLLATSLTVMFAAGIRKRHVATLSFIMVPILAAFIWFERYRNMRLLVFLHPWNPAYTNDGGYQLQQSLIAIFHGGLFGSGLGQGVEPFLYLPIPYADFIFSIIVEELGLLGALVLFAFYSVLIWRGIRISQRLENRFASLLAIGISSMIGFGVLINVGAVTGLLPVTGIPLPFISYGGTALFVKLCAMGILLSLSRYTAVQPVASLQTPTNSKVRQLPLPSQRVASAERRNYHRKSTHTFRR